MRGLLRFLFGGNASGQNASRRLPVRQYEGLTPAKSAEIAEMSSAELQETRDLHLAFASSVDASPRGVPNSDGNIAAACDAELTRRGLSAAAEQDTLPTRSTAPRRTGFGRRGL